MTKTKTKAKAKTTTTTKSAEKAQDKLLTPTGQPKQKMDEEQKAIYANPDLQADIKDRAQLRKTSGHYAPPLGLPEAKLNADERRIVALLRDVFPDALTRDDLAMLPEGFNGDRGTVAESSGGVGRRVSNALRRPMREGFILKVGEGKRGAKYKAARQRARLDLLPEGVSLPKALPKQGVEARPEGMSSHPVRLDKAAKAPAKTPKAPAKTPKAPAKAPKAPAKAKAKAPAAKAKAPAAKAKAPAAKANGKAKMVPKAKAPARKRAGKAGAVEKAVEKALTPRAS